MLVLALACTAAPQPQDTTPGASNLVPNPALDTGVFVPDPASLVLNEVMTDNESTVLDDALELSDWIEIYNTSHEPVALSRVRIESEDGAWAGSEGIVEPHGTALVWAGGSAGSAHTSFSLDNDGERLTLLVDDVAVDHMATGVMAADTSWARFPDGGTWALTARPTAGSTNGARPSESTDPSDLLFQWDHVSDLALTVSDGALDSLESDPDTEVVASLSFEGVTFRDVHLRVKGGLGSSRNLDQKCAWKIDLDDFGHRLRGLESLTLNNMVQDPSYIHEYLAYSLYRAAGVPAPRVGWARVTVNEVPFGLYSWVESVDDAFLARWYADPSGPLFEGAYGVDFTSDDVPAFELDQGEEADRAALAAVVAVLDGPSSDAGVAALERLFDVDELLRAIAVELLALHWDGYTTQNNYRVYLDPVTGRFQLIPWGTDQTFHDRWYGLYEGNGRLLDFCLDNDGCRARYEQAVLDVADVMDGIDLNATIDELVVMLEADIAEDARRTVTIEQVDSYVRTARQMIERWPENVREQLGK
jgi:spore coat protein CotH